MEDNLSRFNNHRGDGEDTKCHCYEDSKTETTHHLFMESEAADYIWKYFGNSLGITSQGNDVRVFINNWWKHKAKNHIHKMLIQIAPCVIFCEKWKSRSNNKAKAQAARHGAIWYAQNGYTGFTLELDSLIIKDMIERN
ncbi:hypothetical protein HAX54_053223 [Datura stramonium]|uniref:RNase H type-1 domain-containing protein n=1 Tax=Datura stramonium TaxID=4076 RepID=A0ABS8WPE4_DATST|nr:hypothetical protein [Datura stramonium]